MCPIAKPIILSSYQRDVLLRKQDVFSEDGKHRWADRCRAIQLRAEGYELKEISSILKRPYRSVQDWCRLWREEGLRGIDPKTSTRGRPKKLDTHERKLLAKAIERGPRSSGFEGNVWTSTMVAEYIRRRWKVDYHPGHVRRLLSQLGFSVQFPRKKLALANQQAQTKWQNETYPSIKKTPKKKVR